MLRQRTRYCQRRLRIQPLAAFGGDQGQAVTGQGTRLVKNKGIHPRQDFNSPELAHQHPCARQRPGGGQHGGGRGQGERAGAGHHQNRHRRHHAALRIHHPPPGPRTRRQQQNNDEKRAGDAVRQRGDIGLGGGGSHHQRGNFGIAGAAAHLRDPADHGAAEVVTARQHRVAHAAQQGPRLATEQSFVNLGAAGLDHAVCRKHLAGADPHAVAHRQPARSNAFACVVRQTAFHAWRHAVDQRLQGTGSAVAQAQLQGAAAEQKKHKHGEGVEIHGGTKQAVAVKSTPAAGHKGDGNTDSHRHVHTNAPRPHITPGTLKVRAAREHQNRQGEHPGRPAQELLHLGRDVTRSRKIGGVGVHHDLHAAQTRNRPAPQGEALFPFARRHRMHIERGQHAVTRLLNMGHPGRGGGHALLPTHGSAVAGRADLRR